MESWAFSSSQYVQAAVKNVEEYVKDKYNLKVPSRAETPIQTLYRPELDASMDLTPVLEYYYISLIGIPGWILDLERVGICLEVSMMSSHMEISRQGHLYQVLSFFVHLKKYRNTEMVFDPSDSIID